MWKMVEAAFGSATPCICSGFEPAVCIVTCVYTVCVQEKSLRKHLPLVDTSVPEHWSPLLICKPKLKANLSFVHFQCGCERGDYFLGLRFPQFSH